MLITSSKTETVRQQTNLIGPITISCQRRSGGYRSKQATNTNTLTGRLRSSTVSNLPTYCAPPAVPPRKHIRLAGPGSLHVVAGGFLRMAFLFLPLFLSCLLQGDRSGIAIEIVAPAVCDRGPCHPASAFCGRIGKVDIATLAVRRIFFRFLRVARSMQRTLIVLLITIIRLIGQMKLS